MVTIVVNRHFDKYDVYIGRGTIWGNPFQIGIDGTREEVIGLYKQYARNNKVIQSRLQELKGQRLGCSCKPAICHGDVLVEMLGGKMYKLIVIGIDQSYTKTGISIAADGKLLKVGSNAFKGCANKSEKRNCLVEILNKLIPQAIAKADKVVIICERIRLMSKGALSINYIKATGALLGAIVDAAYKFSIGVYSVDTRSWKAKIVGTSKPEGTSKIANKIPTLRFVMALGFREQIENIDKKGNKVYNDDAADSACIALYGFLPKSKRIVKKEE
jgi:hypothetical protein